MSQDARKISYFNTLIFTIVSAVVSVVILVLFYFKGLKPFWPFIIALEVGIFFIIGLCITTIILSELALEKKKNDRSYNIPFTSCPDYFTMTNKDNKTYCFNEYIYIDDYKRKFLMKVYPDDDPSDPNGVRPLPSIASSDIVANDPKHEKFNLAEIESEPTFKSAFDRCGPVINDPSDVKLAYLKGYKLLPWTSMRAKCESLVG